MVTRSPIRPKPRNLIDDDGASPSFGGMLRQYRLAARLTQEALANRAGLAVRGIQDLEHRRHQPQMKQCYG